MFYLGLDEVIIVSDPAWSVTNALRQVHNAHVSHERAFIMSLEKFISVFKAVFFA
jgi:hypothetical protein